MKFKKQAFVLTVLSATVFDGSSITIANTRTSIPAIKNDGAVSINVNSNYALITKSSGSSGKIGYWKGAK